MAAITWADVTGFDSTLSAVSAAAQTAIIAKVNAHIYVDHLDGEDGPDVHLARIYLAAHYGLGALPGVNGGGVVASESGGGLSVSYAVPPITDDDLASTAWGRKYLGIMRTSLARVWVLL